MFLNKMEEYSSRRIMSEEVEDEIEMNEIQMEEKQVGTKNKMMVKRYEKNDLELNAFILDILMGIIHPDNA